MSFLRAGNVKKRTRLYVRYYTRSTSRNSAGGQKLDTMARITINITYGQRLCFVSRRLARTTVRPVTLRSRLIAVARGFVLTRKYNLKTPFPVGNNVRKSRDYTVKIPHVPDVLVWLCFTFHRKRATQQEFTGDNRINRFFWKKYFFFAWKTRPNLTLIICVEIF